MVNRDEIINDFKKAWGLYDSESYAGRIGRESLELIADQIDFLKPVLSTLKYHGQIEVDLHITGNEADIHAVKATKFSDFVSNMAESVKIIARANAGVKQWKHNLLVLAPEPGSFRVVLTVPPGDISREDIETLVGTDQETFDSKALGIVANVMNLAQAVTIGESNDTSPLTAAISLLPAQAKSSIAKLGKAVTEAGWGIEGFVRSPFQNESFPLKMSSEGALTLTKAASITSLTREQKTLVGKLDGVRWSTSSVWLIPTDNRPIETVTFSRSLLEQAVSIIEEDIEQEVTAQLEVLTEPPTGTRSFTKRSYHLTSLSKNATLL